MKSLKLNFLLYFFLIMNLYAQSQDFEVSPTKLFFNAEPGSSQIKTITIKNHANKSALFNIKMADFEINSNGETKFIDENSMKSSIARFLSPDPTLIEIKPNEETKISIKLLAPESDNSSKWGVIYISPEKEQTSFTADKKNLSSGVMLSPQIAILAYQTPKSSSKKIIKINNLQEITTYNDTARIFTANIDNLGDIITPCTVYLVAASLQTAEETVFPAIKLDLYPQMSRLIRLSLPRDFPAGKYALSAIVDYGSNAALEGTQILIDVTN